MDLGRDGHGKRKQKRKRGFATKEEAEMALKEFKMRYEHSEITSNGDFTNKGELTLSGLSEQTIKDIVISSIKGLNKYFKVIGTEVIVESGRVDILAKDSQDRDCIIEVKGGMDDPRLSHQVLSYPRCFKKDARMIVIAPNYSLNTLKSLKLINSNIRKIEVYLLTCENSTFQYEKINLKEVED